MFQEGRESRLHERRVEGDGRGLRPQHPVCRPRIGNHHPYVRSQVPVGESPNPARSQGVYQVVSIYLLGALIPFLCYTCFSSKFWQAEHDRIRENKAPGDKLTWDDYKSMVFTQHVSIRILNQGSYEKPTSCHNLRLCDGYFCDLYCACR